MSLGFQVKKGGEHGPRKMGMGGSKGLVMMRSRAAVLGIG